MIGLAPDHQAGRPVQSEVRIRLARKFGPGEKGRVAMKTQTARELVGPRRLLCPQFQLKLFGVENAIDQTAGINQGTHAFCAGESPVNGNVTAETPWIHGERECSAKARSSDALRIKKTRSGSLEVQLDAIVSQAV